MNASQRRKYSKKVERINRRLENVWQSRIQKAVMLKAKIVIAQLKAGGTNAAFQYLATDISNPVLAGQIKRLYTQVGLIHAKRINAELRAEPKTLKSLFGRAVKIQLHIEWTKRLGFNAEWAAFVNNYLEKFLFDKITFAINNTTRDALMRAIQQGINEGLGVDDIIRRLEDWPFARFQAARIIRTEINRAANVGAMAGSSTFEFEQQKEWIAAKDNRTRGNPANGQKDHANHWALDGSIIDQNEVFIDSRNGDQLQFPGDPSASAASVINCRCSVALVGKRDETGRLIPKKAASRISVILPGQFIRRPQTITI